MQDAREIVAKALRRFQRRNAFPTHKAMAEHLHIHASTLGDWARGVSLPTDSNLRKLRSGGVDIPVELITLEASSMFDENQPTGSPPSATSGVQVASPMSRMKGSKGRLPDSLSDSDDPLTDDEAIQFLSLVDVIRDPLHGDIQLTALERCLIDIPEFQRLRDINQLAPTYYVYPGALHTRFLHSLGTLHVCAQMIETVNDNAEKYRRLAPSNHPVPVRMTPYTMLLARLCALLHDTAHVPFGHTLEKEGRVFKHDEWKDPERVGLLFGKDGKPGRFLAPIKTFIEPQGINSSAADGLLADVKAVLTVDSENVSSLRYPFIHDLVGNTICADLVDYVQRDSLFAGLNERFGDRFLKYLAVMPMVFDGDSKSSELRPKRTDATEVTPTSRTGDHNIATHRLTLLQYRYNERREAVLKHDIVAEAVDLVRHRLAVAEKLYFHRTKVVASAMLITAAHAAGLTPMDLWDLSDREVIKLLRDSSSRRAAALGRKLWERKLLKPIYRASYMQSDGSVTSRSLWSDVYQRFRCPNQRENLIFKLEQIIGIARFRDSEAAVGSVAIYCPSRKMNVKSFDMLVLPRPRDAVGRLQDTDHPPTRKEIDAILEMHHHLWKLEVFVDPQVVDLDDTSSEGKKLAGAIQNEIGPRNEVPMFRHVVDQDLQSWIDKEMVRADLEEVGVYEKVSVPHFEQLCNTVYHDEYGKLAPSARLTRVRELLVDMGYGDVLQAE